MALKKKFIIALSLIIVVAIGVSAYYKWYGPERKSEYIEATGIIEATEVDVSPRIPEKIEWLCCREGEPVKKGDLLIKLDNKEFLARLNEGRAVLKSAEAGYKVAEANLENARARVEGAGAELKAAESEVDRARALFQEAKDNLQRISGLFKEGYVTQKEYDAAKAANDATSAQLSAAAAKRLQIKAELSIEVAGLKAAEARVASAKANIGEAEARLKLIETQLKDTEIYSPIDGVIAYKAFEEGEMASSGKSIYTIYGQKNIWARVDVEETVIGRIKLGGKAIVTVMGLPDKKFDSEVIEIGREAEFATQRDVARGRQDIKTFRVKAAVRNPEGFLKPGMTVVVQFK